MPPNEQVSKADQLITNPYKIIEILTNLQSAKEEKSAKKNELERAINKELTKEFSHELIQRQTQP